MFQSIKSNSCIRKVLYNLLSNHESSRPYRAIPKTLLFEAGKNFNLFFRRYAEIEPQITLNISNFIKQDSIIFDIGANIGYFTVFFSHIASKGRTISIEPDPFNLIYLRKNITQNNLYNVEIVNKAVSDRNGVRKIFLDKTTGRTSSLEKDAWHPNSVEIIEDTTYTITLDELSKEYGYPDIIKCDVEGHELSVFKGGEATFTYKPIIFVEIVEKNREALFSILTAHGYKIYNAEMPYSNSSSPLENIHFSNALCIAQ